MGVDVDVNGDGQADNGCLAFVIDLDQCSMAVSADYENNKLTFTQELVSTDFDYITQSPALSGAQMNGDSMINFDPRVSIDFTCEYTADYVTDSSGVTTTSDDISNDLSSSGQFGYSLRTVQASSDDLNSLTNTWSQVSSTGDAGTNYVVGSTLTFEICDQQELSNVYFSVPDCTVYNHNMTESYQIITDHCLDPFVNTARVGRVYQDRFGTWDDPANHISMPTGSSLSASELTTNQCMMFSYTVFEFISNADESADLKLSCKVKACEYSEANPDNMSTCIDNSCATGRKRRSLSNEKYTTVTQSFKIHRPQQ